MRLKAGLSRNFFYKEPKHGRRVDKLEPLARELDWSLSELLGDRGLDQFAKAFGWAMELLREDPDTPEREALTINYAKAIYAWLDERRAAGEPELVDKEAALSLLRRLHRIRR